MVKKLMFIISLLLIGCADYQSQYSAYQENLKIYDRYYSEEQKPAFSLELTDDGKVKKIEYYHQKPAPNIPEFRPAHHPGWQFANILTAGVLGVSMQGLNVWSNIRTSEINADMFKYISGSNCNPIQPPNQSSESMSVINSYNQSTSNDNDTKNNAEAYDSHNYSLTDNDTLTKTFSITDSFNPLITTTTDSNKPIYDSYKQVDNHSQSYTYPIIK